LRTDAVALPAIVGEPVVDACGCGAPASHAASSTVAKAHEITARRTPTVTRSG
jgi:hypothetical protein